MKKIYFIFFLSFTLSIFLKAQQKPINTQQSAQKSVLPTATKPAQPSQPTQNSQAKQETNSRQPSASSIQKKQVTHKRKHNPGVYGNEWINYSQFYYKIKVGQNGLYRISAATLQTAGINIGSIPDSTYQIFFRGQQQYIYVQTKTTNLSAANGDYIEFYGQYNDGVPDSLIYHNIRFLPNPYFSLFTDTSTYYLTWSSSAPHNRMHEQTDTSYSSYGGASPYVMTPTIIAGRAYSTAQGNNRADNIEFQNAPQYFAGSWTADGGFTPNDPRFTQNSAWTDTWISYGSNATFFPNVSSHVYTGGPPAFLRTVVLGVDNGNCTFNIIPNNTAPTLSNIPCNTTTDFPYNYNIFGAIDTTIVIPAVNVPTQIKYFNNALSNVQIIAPTYIYLNYPHTPSLDGDTTLAMYIPDNLNPPYTKSYLFFNNFFTNSPSDTVRIYDLTNHNRFWVKAEGGGFKVVVPNNPLGGGTKQCYMTSDYAVHQVNTLIPAGTNPGTGGVGNGQFTNFSGEPDSVFIIVTHPSLWSEALGYKAYRSSRYNTIVANVEELYDQFGEGVQYSPLGIKRFCNYALNNWASPPSNLLLVGKGIHTHIFRPDTAVWSRAQLLVPSFGDPSSDILFTATLDSIGPFEPAIPTGRLAAANGTEVNTYLGKVETYESLPAALWMKNVAHFAGGDSYIEEQQFVNYLDDYASYIVDTDFGGRVYLFQKLTSAPISGTLTDSIINLIDTGVSIMTFFGHSGGTNWDESVSYPSEYNNVNKYPLMIADACFSGDIFQPIGQAISSVSEQWVLGSPGAIGCLASDYLGDADPLFSYTQTIYEDISYKPFYRKPIGQIIQNSISVNQSLGIPFMPFTCLEVNLHGDPAIAIHGQDSLPDYAVTKQGIYFSPSNVSVLLDSFSVHLIVYNYAEAIDTPVSGTLTRTFPNGVTDNYSFTIKPPKYPYPGYLYYADTVNIKIPVNDSNRAQGQGLNYFTASINLTPTVPWELTYANNSIGNPGVPLLISSEDIEPIWPYDYAIIPNDTVTLKASTDDPFAPRRTYIFEIDTSHNFNSPLFRSDTVTNSGGVIMASPFANWGTIHFTGLLHAGSNIAGNKMGVKGPANKQVGNLTAPNNLGAKVNASQSNSAVNSPMLSPKNPVTANKQTAGAVPDVVHYTGMGAQNTNSAPGNIKKKHGPINLTFRDTTVYYWRVRRDTIDSTGIYNWVNTSFEYIKGKNGWGQSSFFQYDNDEIQNDNYNFINFNTPPRGWSFNTNGHTIQCNTFGMLNLSQPGGLYSTQYTIDNFLQTSGGCQYDWGVYVAVIDPTNPTTPWSTEYHNGIGNINNVTNQSTCTEYPDNKFIFWDNDPIQMKALVRMLEDSIPNGDYILAYSWIEGVFKAPALQYSDSVIAEFQRLGATQMPYHANTPGLDSVPWIFFVQKGVPGSAKQVYGATSVSTPPPIGNGLQLSAVMAGNGTYGAITTPLIGPAVRYDSLSWHQHSNDHPNLDSTRLNIIGVQPNGQTKILTRNITPTVAGMYLSSINPAQFPYIQLQLYTKDVAKATPGQMNWWRVFYQPVPEIAMNPNIYTYYHADTLQYGDVLNFQTTVQNVSDWPIASTQLLTWTTNQTNSIIYYNQGQMVKALNPGDTAKISFTLPDAPSNVNTLQSVWFEINPENYPNTRLEQYHFNDYASKTFYSYGDKINPVLDVTFNGIHILNNDIVSAQPGILITFMDENKFLALNNANDFKVYLNPIGAPLTPAPFAFTPATLPQNRCSLLLNPTLPDGTYQLTVQGSDISGNLSAANSYTIDFQVINKSMITEVLNYPNPFSTATRFVFILTGEQIPTIFKIQIMTVSGKIVREINEDEIGPIHIGRNITQYAWDGTDKYGAKLANGVYLYRVVTSINGQGIDEYQQGYQGANVDQYFTKGWGKMYLMR